MGEHKERLSPSIPPDAEAWWEETAHLWRYYYAVERLKDEGVSAIVDAACGTGYGSSILYRSDSARYVYGFDRPDVVESARRVAGLPMFGVDLDTDERGRITRDISSESDALVCLETLEHLKDPWMFLGIVGPHFRHLICSAPIVPNSNPYNPYHRHDFTLESFRALVTGAGFVIQDERLQSSPWRINLYAVVHAVRPIPKEDA